MDGPTLIHIWATLILWVIKKKDTEFGEGPVGVSLREAEEGNEGDMGIIHGIHVCHSQDEKIFLLKHK